MEQCFGLSLLHDGAYRAKFTTIDYMKLAIHSGIDPLKVETIMVHIVNL